MIHNDFRLDNLVLDPADPLRVRGVLDWEMATLGDPLMDLGSSLAYWVQRRRRPRRAAVPQTAVAPARHADPRARSSSATATRDRSATAGDWPFYEVFGLFRLAVIAQQIYYRYHHRQTRNPAFRRFWLVAHMLERRCRKAIRAAG